MGSLDSFYTGLGRTWPLLWVTLFATAINLVGDYALIFGHWGCPKLGIAGAAWATVLSQCGAVVLLAIMVGQRRHDQRFHLWRGWRFQRDLCWRLLRFGTPSGAQFLVDIAGFSVFILLVGGLGTTALTATTLAFNVNMLAFMPMIGTGIAVSILVGNRLGANQPELAERATYSGFQIAAFYMAVVGLTYVLMPELYLAPFASKADPTTFPEVERLTIILLRFVALYCLFDGANIIFSSAVKGAGDTRFVMYALAITSTCGLVLPSWIGIKLCGGGLLTAWYIIPAYICLLAALYYWRFKGGKWKHMRVTGDAPPPPV
jgi:MATE family multidrug resistance protein